MPLPGVDLNDVFLNIPYDEEFRSLYISIVGLCQLGSGLQFVKIVDDIPERNGTHDPFGQGVFKELCGLSSRISEVLRQARTRES